ncbi:MAG: carboxy terminal-processing peptidase [Bacilli bacterium]
MKWDSISPDVIEHLYGYGLPQGQAEALMGLLTKQSEKRQKSLEDFALWNERLDWVKARQAKRIELEFQKARAGTRRRRKIQRACKGSPEKACGEKLFQAGSSIRQRKGCRKERSRKFGRLKRRLRYRFH